MKYAIRTILAAATVAAAYYFTPSAPGKDIQAVELEQQYECMIDSELMRGDAETYAKPSRRLSRFFNGVANASNPPQHAKCRIPRQPGNKQKRLG